MIGRLVLITLVTLVAATDAEAATRCGTKTLYGKTYTLYATNVSCEETATITAAKCDVFAEPWFCGSNHAPGPAMWWGKASEMFDEEPTTWIEARRPPCTKVTAADWKRAKQQPDDQFPTEQQLLADDLIRCKQLRRGMTWAAVAKLLGNAGKRPGRDLSWMLGPQRDSVFQVDGEFLSVAFDRKRKVRSVGIHQG